MRRFAIILILLLSASVLGAFWPVTVREAITPSLATTAWGSTPLHEVDVASLTSNMDRAEYIRAAAIRQYQLVQLYTDGTIVMHGHTFAATPQTITAIKVQFAALRTRVTAAEDAITAD
jgi:hypothetical protein